MKNKPKTLKVLIIEDEKNIAQSIEYALKREKYQVDIAYDGSEGIEKVESFNPDLVILDIMMPVCDGYEVCKFITNKSSSIGILMLTAKTELIDRVLGLELGADDYLTKPFEMTELLARVKSLSRRLKNSIATSINKDNLIEINNLNINFNEKLVTIKGKEIDFAPKEFELLEFLIQNERQVFSRDQIIESVWDMSYEGGTRTVDIHIQRIRKKLGHYGILIETVPKFGYKAVIKIDKE